MSGESAFLVNGFRCKPSATWRSFIHPFTLLFCTCPAALRFSERLLFRAARLRVDERTSCRQLVAEWWIGYLIDLCFDYFEGSVGFLFFFFFNISVKGWVGGIRRYLTGSFNPLCPIIAREIFTDNIRNGVIA